VTLNLFPDRSLRAFVNLLAALLLLQSGCRAREEHPIDRVLLYLARHQNEDGSWSQPPAHCNCPSRPPLQVRLPIVPDEETRKRFQALCETLQDDRPSDRERAQKDLFTLGLPVVPLLQEASTHVDAEVRERCREALVDLWERNPEVKDLFRSVAAPETADFEVKATSLALLTFFGSGDTQFSQVERSDPINDRPYHYGRTVKKAVRWLTEHQKEDGSFPAVHPETQAIAALVLSECYGMTAASALQEPAQKAVTYIRALQSPELSFGLWKGFALHSASLSSLAFSSWDPEPLLRRFEEAPSPLSESGTILVSAFMNRPCEPAKRRFLRLVQSRLSPEERFLATFAAGRVWKVGSQERGVWDDEMLSARKPLQITSLQCDRGAWSDSPELFESRLLATIYAGLTLERTYRYANVLFPDPR
jgi:hypothetical protein